MLSIAYRMVGSFSEAEDIVQEAYVRLHETDEPLESTKAWLSTVVTRLSIDHLRSARVRREQYTGTWLPEPVLADPAPDAAAQAETAESLSLALLVVLESLSPVERAVFLLRDVFGYGYGEIAEIVGKSEANCRQLATRARRHVEERRPRFEPSAEQRDELTRRFFAAAQQGETEPLLELLAEDAEFYGDGGGKVPAIPKPLFGRRKVARFVLSITRIAKRDDLTLHLAQVNGQPGAVGIDREGRVAGVLSLDIVDGRVTTIRSIVNPDKLAHISSTILPSLPPDLKRS
jgi:RNA polymerase sigma-70 factor (TIGR02957 family)